MTSYLDETGSGSVVVVNVLVLGWWQQPSWPLGEAEVGGQVVVWSSTQGAGDLVVGRG